LIKRLTDYLFRFYKGSFFQADVDTDCLIEDMDMDGCVFKEIPNECFGIDPIFADKKRFQRFQAHSEKGHRCYGFFDKKNSIASYLWSSIPDEEIEIPWVFDNKLVLRQGDGYVWDCFTAPKHRGKGFYKNGLRNARSIHFKKGIKRVYICCAEGNLHSKRGIISAGFKEIFAFSVVKIGPMCIVKKDSERVKIISKRKSYDIIG